MISILSDFGLDDTYVAAMKAVIHSIAPVEEILDLTHNVPPGDILRAAVELWRIAPLLPPGTIILAVVDPGVGTDRKAVAFQSSRFTCVGPDNGLFSFLLNQTDPIRIVELNNPEYQSGLTSTTFHGRDIFAPAAAHIANGVHLEKLGAYLDRLIRLPQPILQIEEGQPILGEILYADRFGNLVTSIGVLSRRDERLSLVAWIGEYQPVEAKINKPIVLLPDGEKVNFHSAFGEVPEGSLIAYIGSSGLMELAVNGASASEITGLQRGERIELRLQG
jgi:hypothetical protein